MCVDNTYFEVYLEKEKALLNENIRIKNRKKKKSYVYSKSKLHITNVQIIHALMHLEKKHC